MKIGYQVIRKFIIGQKQELNIIILIKTLLKSNAKIQQMILRKSDLNQYYYRIEICSLISNTILLHYLIKFPCLGQKKINMLVYQRLNGYIVRKQHLTLTKLEKIKKLCQQLQKHNSFFNDQNSNCIKVEDIVHCNKF